MNSKQFILVGAAALLSASLTYSQNIKYEAFKLSEIIVSTNWDKAKPGIDAMFDGFALKLKDDRANEKANQVVLEEMRRAFSRDNFSKMVAEGLSENMTEAELREVLAFWQSPVGIKYQNANANLLSAKAIAKLLAETCNAAKSRLSFIEQRGPAWEDCRRY